MHGVAVMICRLTADDIPSLAAWIKKSLASASDFLVRLMGLEPIRLPTRPSNVRVCQFRHSRI